MQDTTLVEECARIAAAEARLAMQATTIWQVHALHPGADNIMHMHVLRTSYKNQATCRSEACQGTCIGQQDWDDHISSPAMLHLLFSVEISCM